MALQSVNARPLIRPQSECIMGQGRELRDKVVWYKAKRRKAIEATTASCKFPGLIILMAEGQEGHAWMMISWKMAQTDDELH